MNRVQVLIEGYAKPGNNGSWLASSSTTLITTGSGKRIIVDPGINRRLLLKKLRGLGLGPKAIDVVFMTHYHPDHNLLTAIFEKADFYDDTMIYRKDWQGEHQGKIERTDLKIIKTPGHESFHGSLVVRTSEGIIVVAGDVFWWDSTEERKVDRKSLLSHVDPFVKDEKALLESRRKLLEIADWIIPGHGKMFKVEK